jgi:hypothetical protein
MTISLSSEFSSIILANPANSTTVGSAENDYILGTTGSGFIDGGVYHLGGCQKGGRSQLSV